MPVPVQEYHFELLFVEQERLNGGDFTSASATLRWHCDPRAGTIVQMAWSVCRRVLQLVF